jgi:hypothetical protein
LLHPLSLASGVLRRFQLTPSHIEEALPLVALAFMAVSSIVVVPFIVVAFIVVQPCAVEWRSASVLLPSALLPREPITRHAADTIPTHRATRACAAVIERSVTAAAAIAAAVPVSAARQAYAGTRGGTGWKLSGPPVAFNDDDSFLLRPFESGIEVDQGRRPFPLVTARRF